jgi:endonuclease/exonuclease/phosphatase family metal-dependent hydrolase
MKAKKKKLPFIDKLFLFINIPFSAALLLSYLAPVVNPSTFWLIAFFGLAYPFLLLANIILAIYWLLRLNTWILLPVICIAIGWNVLTGNIGFRAASDDIARPPGANVIRVMTYNVHDFKRYGFHNDLPTKIAMLQIISQQQPDIIGFQEYYTRFRGQYAITDSIKKIMQTPYVDILRLADSNKDQDVGMAIFSKFPIVSSGVIALSAGGDENQCIYVDVKKNNKMFRFYSIHLQSIDFEPQDYKYIDSVSSKAKTDMSSTKRLVSKLKNAFVKRSEQVKKIKDLAAKCPYPYIISGDFNDTPASFAVNQMAKGLKNAFREKGSGFGKTYNGDFPNFQIDYIMASPQFDVASYKIIEKKLSDHYGVRSDVVLK